ncbi:flagellar FliL protein [Carnobacterium iners]|uniref:Flagellar protein FliL n=1 Tax=Carnobacterium iners TaxID=1073423 RepID=A0A1X7N0T5_9LACT|nr:flagellar basal body-associated FliL family protein [Carnobacterium iners]SEK22158.1 flagellar FliL protein [Carnobacterium iners]SMH30841.1 flagellar FliL protein [Carnobacterium iners]
MKKKSDGKETDETKKKKWFLPVIIIISTVIIGGVIVFGFTSGKAQAFMKNLSEEKVVETTVPLEEFLINLTSEEGKKEQFLKIELSVYSEEKDSQEVIVTKTPQIRNAVINVLRKQTPETVFGEDQELIALKQELISQINKSLGKSLISDIFITNIIMQ